MKLITNKKELEVEYAEGPTRITGNLVILLHDDRPFSEVCADFEGLETIRTEDGKEWVGFTDLVMAARLSDNSVRISLSKGVN